MASKFGGLTPDIADTARMTILDPVELRPLINRETGEPAWIDLLPADSPAGAAHDRKVQDGFLRQRRRVTSEDTEKAAIGRLAALSKNWSLCLLDGTPLDIPCNETEARDLYTEIRWLRDQVAAFTADLGNFRKAHSETSSSTPSINPASTN